MLELRGIHYLATRFGGRSLRRRAFDAKYTSGTWVFDRPDPALNALVERYAAGGEILILGCGRAAIASHLDPATYSRLLGIDLSPVAIMAATSLAIDGASFEVGDMTEQPSSGAFSVILLPESVYYVPPYPLAQFFEHLRGLLAPGGVVIATVGSPGRYAGVIDEIRNECVVLQDWSDPSVLVFR